MDYSAYTRYCAYGKGEVVLKEGIDADNVLDQMKTLLKNSFCIECRLSKNGIYIADAEDLCHKEDNMEILNFLIPYITEGDITYFDDYDCFWKFIFNPETQKWDKIDGDVYYTDNDLIQELEKRGYKVTKIQEKPRSGGKAY